MNLIDSFSRSFSQTAKSELIHFLENYFASKSQAIKGIVFNKLNKGTTLSVETAGDLALTSDTTLEITSASNAVISSTGATAVTTVQALNRTNLWATGSTGTEGKIQVVAASTAVVALDLTCTNGGSQLVTAKDQVFQTTNGIIDIKAQGTSAFFSAAAYINLHTDNGVGSKITLNAPTITHTATTFGIVGGTTTIGSSGTAGTVTIGDNSIMPITVGKATDLVGFFGATPVAQAGHPTTLGNVITILQNLGLCA